MTNGTATKKRRVTDDKLVEEAIENNLMMDFSNETNQKFTGRQAVLRDHLTEILPGYKGLSLRNVVNGSDMKLFESINNYIKGSGINRIKYPPKENVVSRLIPITENLSVWLLIVNEGIEKSITMDAILINKSTTTDDLNQFKSFIESL